MRTLRIIPVLIVVPLLTVVGLVGVHLFSNKLRLLGVTLRSNSFGRYARFG
jgi:hypothetical protein